MSTKHYDLTGANSHRVAEATAIASISDKPGHRRRKAHRQHLIKLSKLLKGPTDGLVDRMQRNWRLLWGSRGHSRG